MRRHGGAGRAEIIRPGLDRILAALELAGHPEAAFRTLHVAGTNGKGSVSVMLEAVVRGALRRPVGLYTSPHLVVPEERIRLSGRKIGAAALGRLLGEAATLSRAVAEKGGEPLSFFEEMTWAACAWFARRKVAYVVMEAGLGGRWDATSACRPAVSVITSVGIDHADWLGGTLSRIAFEKAGIIRPGVPLVTGPLRPAARKVVAARARDEGAPLWELGRDFGWTDGGNGRIGIVLPGAAVAPVRPAMEGRFQRDNIAVACAAAWNFLSGLGVPAEVFIEAARAGIGSTRIPGRFCPIPGIRSPRVWADGAHNPDAAGALSAELPGLKRRFGAGRVIALWSMLRDKDIKGFLRRLGPAVDGVVSYPLVHERAAGRAELAAAVAAAGIRRKDAGSFSEGWEAASRWAGKRGIVIICGSLVAVGDAYRFLAAEEVS